MRDRRTSRRLAFEPIGYRREVVGQKSYNGVAVLARVPFEVTHRALPGLGPRMRRRATSRSWPRASPIGNSTCRTATPAARPATPTSLPGWTACASARRWLLAPDTPLSSPATTTCVPTDEDFAPGTLSPTDALVRPETRARYRALLWLGLTDAIRAIRPSGPVWTFWDYQAGAWPRDRGLRIDHALLSPAIAERLVSAAPDRAVRGEEQPSDHVPVTVEIA